MERKKIIYAGIALIAIICVLNVIFTNGRVTVASDDLKLTDYQQQESKSNYMLHKLIDSFGTAEDGRPLYPDNYAGAYIADDGALVVLYKEGEVQDVSVLEPLSYGASYSIETRKYSYNELYYTYMQIADLLGDQNNPGDMNYETKKKIRDFYIQESDNKVYVGIIDMQQDAREFVEQNVDCPEMLVFQEAFEIYY